MGTQDIADTYTIYNVNRTREYSSLFTETTGKLVFLSSITTCILIVCEVGKLPAAMK